jgi:DNA polymerase-3 subunit epsilon/CBS domain-containing protein
MDLPTNRNASQLIAIDAVFLDTETTGLDAATARIIQIGAMHMNAGVLDLAGAFDTLVDPGVPVPASSTAIHGLGDADVASAPGFATVAGALTAFLADRVLIGHSIGYDLAILAREAAAAGVPWRRPRSLDIRQLARVASPGLVDVSLDTIASWLAIAIEGRHTALGDARAAADVYLALIPHLRARGVRTLAEAERACRALAAQAEEDYRAGWQPAVAASAEAETRALLSRIDSFPYRHRIRDVMSAPPITISADASALEAVALLVERNISSVYVTPPGGGEPDGIVTERDLLRALAAHGPALGDRRVGELASRPLQTVPADAFLYRAIGRMARLRLRHLGVADAAGGLVGAVTNRDLLRVRAGEAISLGDEIDSAADAAALAVAWAKLPLIAERLLDEAVEPRQIAAVVSREMCAVTRKAAILAERRMIDEGAGPPPVSYAVLVLGSGGRGESLLAADQDNAIVFAEGEPDGDADRYFAGLAGHMADILDAAGIPYCKGGVMARNPPWRHSVAGWKATVDGWIRRQRPEDLLNVDIFYDFRAVHGSQALADEVWAYAYERARDAYDFIKLLAESQTGLAVPLGLFGSLKTDDGRVDLKIGGLLPLVAGARALAIRHGVREHATPVRLAQLRDLEVGSADDFDGAIRAHGIILGHVLRQQVADIHDGIAPSNRVEVRRQTRGALAELKQTLRFVQDFGHTVRHAMFSR